MKAITMNEIKAIATTHGSVAVALKSAISNRRAFILDLSGVLFLICNEMKEAKTIEDQQKVYNKFRKAIATIRDTRQDDSVYYGRLLNYMHTNMPNHTPTQDKESGVWSLKAKKGHENNRIKFTTPKLQAWYMDDDAAGKAYTVEEQQERAMRKIQQAINEAVKLGCEIKTKDVKEMIAKAAVKAK